MIVILILVKMVALVLMVSTVTAVFVVGLGQIQIVASACYQTVKHVLVILVNVMHVTMDIILTTLELVVSLLKRQRILSLIPSLEDDCIGTCDGKG